MKALSVEIFTSSIGNCSNHGISSRFREILIPCEDGPIYVDEENPPENLCKIVKRDLGFCEHIHVEPWNKPNGAGWMYGGTVVDSSDSRWHRATGINYPLHLHDRCESWEMNDIMSR